MIGRILRILPILLVLGVTACGGTKTVTVTETQTVTATVTETQPAETTAVRVYFLRDGKVAPFAREVPKTTAVAGAALTALVAGPSTAELVTTAIPPSSPVPTVTIANGTATVTLPAPYSQPALAQLVYTLTQFPTARTVAVGGTTYTRADFENLTPAILVESPLPFETVRSPLHATGTANTFEATFQYELKDAAGRILAMHFVTATSGSGTRGTFDFTAPFTVDHAGPGTLTVYENSAENGRRVHISAIPLQLEP